MSDNLVLSSETRVEDLTYYSILTTLPREHGGMTRAAMRRGNALRAAGLRAALVTLDMEEDMPGLISYVKKHSELHDLPVINLYDHIATNDLNLPEDKIKQLSIKNIPSNLTLSESCVVEDQALSSEEQTFRIRTFKNKSNEICRINYYDRNNQKFMVEEFKPITGGQKVFTIFDRTNGNIKLQTNVGGLRLIWLDSLLSTQHCAIIIDSPPVSELLEKYTRPNVLKVLVNHLQHTLPTESTTSGALEPKRVAAFRHSSTFDFMLCLTKSQAADMEARIGTACPVEIIPNVNPDAGSLGILRDPSLCIVVARMNEKHKRISHILEAFAVAHKLNPDIRLELYGGPLEGATWDEAQRICNKYQLHDFVVFHGSKGGAADEFSRAGFTVLTSAFEGQGMTLVEAMSRGAIPLSYDIHYGPSDTIADGVDGFLVSDGDYVSLGERMAQVAAGGAEIESMRGFALASSRPYQSSQIAARYKMAVQAAIARRPVKNLLSKCRSELVGIEYKKNQRTRLLFELKGPASVIENEDLRITLRAYNHHTLHYATFECLVTEIGPETLSLYADIEGQKLSSLGKTNVAAAIRLEIHGTRYDIRPFWWKGWGVSLRDSPSGRVDFR